MAFALGSVVVVCRRAAQYDRHVMFVRVLLRLSVCLLVRSVKRRLIDGIKVCEGYVQERYMIAQPPIFSQNVFSSSGDAEDERRGARSPRIPAASTVSLLTLRASHSSRSAWLVGWRNPGGASLGGQRNSSLGRARKPETTGDGGFGAAGIVEGVIAVEIVVIEKVVAVEAAMVEDI